MAENTLTLDQPGAWRQGTCQESRPVGTPYDDVWDVTYQNRVATASPIPTLGQPASVQCETGYYLYVLGFDSDGAYLGRAEGCANAWVTSYVADFDCASYLMLVVRKSTNEAISPIEAADARVTVTLAGGVAR